MEITTNIEDLIFQYEISKAPKQECVETNFFLEEIKKYDNLLILDDKGTGMTCI